MSRRPVTKPQTGSAVAKGLAALGVPSGASAAVAVGLSAAVAKALPAALDAKAMTTAQDVNELEGDYDLIVVGDGLSTPSLAATRNRVIEKPFTPSGLRSVVEAAIASARR